MSPEERALWACVDYNGWAIAVARLTAAIADNECPQEAPEAFDASLPQRFSCFAKAKDTPVIENHLGEERRRTLDEIGEAVADCEACSQLVVDIRGRRFARQRFGVAKREIRSIARSLL